MSNYLGVSRDDPVHATVTVTGLIYESVQDALTAFAGGGQASATQITAMNARVTTVVTIGDSAKLPFALPGLYITVINAAANSMNVFPSTGDGINALAANAAYAVAGGKVVSFICTVKGTWYALLSA